MADIRSESGEPTEFSVLEFVAETELAAESN